MNQATCRFFPHVCTSDPFSKKLLDLPTGVTADWWRGPLNATVQLFHFSSGSKSSDIFLIIDENSDLSPEGSWWSLTSFPQPTIFPCTRTAPNPPPLLMMNYVIEKKNYNKGNSAKMYLPTHAHAVIFLFILSSAHLGGRCVLTLEVYSSAWVFIFFCLLYNIYCFLSTNYFASPHPSQTCINTSHL